MNDNKYPPGEERRLVNLAAAKENRQPHYAGHVRCRKCGHIWTAVCPTTANPFFLECSKCGRMEGMMSAIDLNAAEVQRHYEQRLKDDRLRAHMESDY